MVKSPTAREPGHECAGGLHPSDHLQLHDGSVQSSVGGGEGEGGGVGEGGGEGGGGGDGKDKGGGGEGAGSSWIVPALLLF